MGMTLTQKILAAHAGLPEVKAGQLINARLDIVLGNDITTPVAINEFEKAGFDGVFDKEHIAIVLDHFVPNKDIKSATQSKQCREFANKYDILNFYDVGQMGVEHALLPEKGIVTAGDCIIGADSHTCTYGALGAFSTGVGSTDMAAGMATGMAWFKVPSAIKFVLKGKFSPCVSGKDLILHIIGMIGVDGALYKSMEFTGPGVASLTMEDRLCVCNMAIEAGAKNGIFPVDEVTRAYLNGRSPAHPRSTTRLTRMPNTKRPSRSTWTSWSPRSATPICRRTPTPPARERTSGSIRWSSAAAPMAVWRIWRPLTTSSRADTLPRVCGASSSRPPWRFIRSASCAAGPRPLLMRAALYLPPPAAPAWAATWASWAEGERCVSTTNRNFVGRMGHVDSEVYPGLSRHRRRQRPDRLHHRPAHGLTRKEHEHERKRFCFQIPG